MLCDKKSEYLMRVSQMIVIDPAGPLPNPIMLSSLTVSILLGPAPMMPILVTPIYLRLAESRTLLLDCANLSK